MIRLPASAPTADYREPEIPEDAIEVVDWTTGRTYMARPSEVRTGPRPDCNVTTKIVRGSR